MRRALAHLPPALLLLLATVTDSAPSPRPYDFVDNYRDAAPSPQEGPPASANASRDRSLLPAQICGIVAGYIGTVLIWGILLLTVGRRMRRKMENSPKTLELELVTRRSENTILSPTSPIGSSKSVSSWRKRLFRKEKEIESGGIGRGDDSPMAISPVVHSPTSFDQRVLDANKAKAQAEMERLYAAVMDHDRKKSITSQASLESYDPHSRRPSAINTQPAHAHSNPSSPVRPIYPHGYSAHGPPTAPLPLPRDRPSSPRSVLSKKSTASSSPGSKRFNIKSLRISGPLQKYPGEMHAEEERTPLSPRHYGDPGAPPSPPTMANSSVIPGGGVDKDTEDAETLDTVRPLPRAAPQRAPSPSALSKSPMSSQNELPLRGYAEPLRSPTLRTTVLNRRVQDPLSMTTPRTGVPYTPYSPYMPFTPITPVTPHLVTKKERKQARKWEGRKAPDARTDMVQSPKEIFGDAW
ncbi:hypothetical protein BU23DRAFT_557573 [Bimuria novae-zelandiae CBS 107.79]|uniref:Uncharacterized protein n=1 Tax=Bimuria novae-zelandiae CBS 107.79 TaxID=1447943 RepID=A0A6A5V8C1_9PLEO|nr:hypothetical protein BU23DRAFT_557573 [Bimuria novae-zelandiae CBS 107.79]